MSHRCSDVQRRMHREASVTEGAERALCSDTVHATYMRVVLSICLTVNTKLGVLFCQPRLPSVDAAPNVARKVCREWQRERSKGRPFAHLKEQRNIRRTIRRSADLDCNILCVSCCMCVRWFVMSHSRCQQFAHFFSCLSLLPSHAKSVLLPYPGLCRCVVVLALYRSDTTLFFFRGC